MPVCSIRGLRGILTGVGFAARRGRRPALEDVGFIQGSAEIRWDSATGRILAVGKYGDVESAPVERSWDVEGCIATPGFIDSHTHAIFPKLRMEELVRLWRGASYHSIAQAGGGIRKTIRDTSDLSDDVLVAQTAKHLRSMLKLGSTTVEVKSGYGRTSGDELRLLRLVGAAAHVPSVPHVIPTFLGLHAVPDGQHEEDYVNAMIGALPEIKQAALAHSVDSFPEMGFFSLHSALRFSRAAKELGFGVKAHADELSAMGAGDAFCAMGALSIDHLQHVSDACVEALASASTVAVLLPATSFCLNLPFADARRLIDRGARVALATDFNPGSAPWPSMAFTMLLAASKLHMSPSEILCAVTYGGGAALGIEKSRGTLAEGMAADFNIFDLGATDVQRILEEVCITMPQPRLVICGGAVATQCTEDKA